MPISCLDTLPVMQDGSSQRSPSLGTPRPTAHNVSMSCRCPALQMLVGVLGTVARHRLHGSACIQSLSRGGLNLIGKLQSTHANDPAGCLRRFLDGAARKPKVETTTRNTP